MSRTNTILQYMIQVHQIESNWTRGSKAPSKGQAPVPSLVITMPQQWILL